MITNVPRREAAEPVAPADERDVVPMLDEPGGDRDRDLRVEGVSVLEEEAQRAVSLAFAPVSLVERPYPLRGRLRSEGFGYIRRGVSKPLESP